MEPSPSLLITDDNAPIIHLLTSLLEGHATVPFAQGGLEGIRQGRNRAVASVSDHQHV